MNRVIAKIENLIIPTYPEPPAEEMPMFAENRVHQRTSGRPYPNKVVMRVDRSQHVKKEYTVVRLENEYIKIEILPEIGGRIYSAIDKITGYDFFYKQHVIKPALIGVLGSWISGGVEFNWPFHHRASGFMPCDFNVEECPDGSAICWLSEHDPIDRMKGMVGIVLKPGETCFETRIRLYNRSAVPHSFLWWENAAVPVNEDYRIFFPQDVSYVNFHYLKSRTTYPIAGNGVFNGIQMDEERDISWHKNTRQATSYFASASDYDFFGGYDYGKQCGVVHIGDHHISPGKKMFTWAYCQLAKSWENALTDTDGQYAELMAGSYSDNQPNFSWIAPYETKVFSQYWYPISKIGSPIFANLNCAVNLVRDGENSVLSVQTTRSYDSVHINVSNGEQVIFDYFCSLSPEDCCELELVKLPEFVTIRIFSDNVIIAEYTEQKFDQFDMPEPIADILPAEQIGSIQELYLAGVHIDQYRDPAVLPEAYWREALRRDAGHIPSLISMARYEYNRFAMDEARSYIERAIKQLTVYNERLQSGEAYYVYGLILEAQNEDKKAYDYYYKAAWAADSVEFAMTRISVLDMKNGDADKALRHSATALNYNGNNSLATAVYILANRIIGDTAKAEDALNTLLASDPLDHMARFIAGVDNFYRAMESSASQICLDLAFNLAAMGRYGDVIEMLTGLIKEKPDEKVKMVLYALGYYTYLNGGNGSKYYEVAQSVSLGKTYPSRFEEKLILEDVIVRCNDKQAKLLLGDLLYNKLWYERSAGLWSEVGNVPEALRNLAVACFSHLNRRDEALPLMMKALEMIPDNEQLLYETIVLMDKLSVNPQQKIDLILSHTFTRDDIQTELAKAYNQAANPDKAIKTLMSHEFVPCEGGEHAIADQYFYAYFIKGRDALAAGNLHIALALLRDGQILPQSLGAGIWNHCKLIPLKYHEAVCLQKLGQEDEAKKIFRYITGIQIEYFSNMHLKELPYYQAKSFDHLGESLKGQQLITKYLREWEKIIDSKDSGYFCTTPFFISFMDDPATLRRSQYLYLTALCEDYRGNADIAKQRIIESNALNSENMYSYAFIRQGFLL